MAITPRSVTNMNLQGMLVRFRPSAKEFHKTAINISKELENNLSDTRKRVLEGTLSRDMGIKTLRAVAGTATSRIANMANESQQIQRNIQDLLNTNNGYNASDVLSCTKELLDIAQEVSLEMTTAMRAIRSNWELYEETLDGWVQDIQFKGLR